MRRYHVETVCTTDDPVDDLHNHIEYAKTKGEKDARMIPAWRPDKAMNIEKPDFADYVNKLEEVSGVTITTFKDMVDALQKRHDFFHEMGSRLSDHGIEEFYDEPYTDAEIEKIFAKAMKKEALSELETRQYKHCFLKICDCIIKLRCSIIYCCLCCCIISCNLLSTLESTCQILC